MRLLARRAAALLFASVASGVAAAGLPSAASAASQPVIVYQCPGSGGTHLTICAVSPDGGQPRMLAQTGYVAGVTRDGTTYGYFGTSGGTWEAPVAGGAPTEVNAGPGPTTFSPGGLSVGSINPVMSSDGQHFLTEFLSSNSGFSAFQVDQWNAGGPSSPTTIASGDPSLTYGWLGATPLTAVNSGPPSWVCIGGQVNAGGCAQGATSPQIQSSTSGLAWPSGSPDGTRIVATVTPHGEQDDGSIALFSATTGAMIETIATPPAGTGYTEPRFSPDGTQVVFESDPLDANDIPSGQSSIDVVNTDGSGLRTVARGPQVSGSHLGGPSWGTASSTGGGGGTRGSGTSGTKGGAGQPAAPKVTLTVPRQKLGTVRRTRRLTVTCKLAGAGTCTIKATITANTARHLKLKLSGKHAQTYALASASKSLKKKGTVKLTLRLSARTAGALRHATTLKITMTASSTAPKHKARSASKTVTLR